MNVLVLYATEEGQTGKIARFSAEEVQKLGHSVTLVDVDEPSELNLESVDSVVLASPVHQRRHNKAFEASIAAFREELKDRKTLLLSVSLSAAFPEGLEEAREYVTEMNMRTGFTPDVLILVAGAVRTSQYDYFALQVVQHVLLRGRDFDRAIEEHEFTDWAALSQEIAEFLN